MMIRGRRRALKNINSNQLHPVNNLYNSLGKKRKKRMLLVKRKKKISCLLLGIPEVVKVNLVSGRSRVVVQQQQSLKV